MVRSKIGIAIFALVAAILLAGAYEALRKKASILVARIEAQSAKIDRLSAALNIGPEVGQDHTNGRVFAIRSQIEQASDPVIVIGDSITEGALIPESVCGHAIINAGIGGLDVGSYPANKIFSNGRHVALIVVALGTNNSSRHNSKTDGFATSYRTLLDILAPHASRIALAGIPTVEITGALAQQWFSPDLIDFNNDTIREIAKERRIEFIDLRSNPPTTGLTVDGVHPNARGYQSWSAAMTKGMQSAVDCNVVGIR